MKPSVLFPWLLIAFCSVYAVATHAIEERARRAPAAATSPAGSDGAPDVRVTLTGKYIVGSSRLVPRDQRGQLLESVPKVSSDPAAKVADAVLAGELVGRDEALKRLARSGSLDAEAFAALYESGTPLSAGVVERYQYFARLAAVQGEADDKSARAAVLRESSRVVVVLLGFIVMVAVAGVVGLGLLITAVVLLALGKIRLAQFAPSGPHAIYLQAFAIYLTLLVFSGDLIHLVWPGAPGPLRYVLVIGCVAVAALYPLLRGVPGATYRADWGLVPALPGRSPWLEPIYGILGYLAALPLMAVAIGVTVFLSRLADYDVSHPIGQSVMSQPWLMFFLAVIFAPFTEELLFRGGFLAHCRRWSGPVISGLVTALVFAAVHPQGWPAIPILGTIGFVLAMLRQWRGSLIAPITAHALNNGTVLTLLLLTR